MAEESPRTEPERGIQADEHRTEGSSPRDVPATGLDASPPQPNAPEQSETEQQQDQQPVEAGHVLETPEHLAGREKELINGEGITPGG